MRKNSFAIRVVKSWNSLPEKIVSAPTTNTVKNKFDKYWSNQSLMYEDHKTTSPMKRNWKDPVLENQPK